MSNKEQTKLIFENYGSIYTWQTDHSDVDVEDCLYALYGLMVSATFSSISVLKGMKEFAEIHLETIKEMSNYNENEEDI